MTKHATLAQGRASQLLIAVALAGLAALPASA
jgi:hypothetical protein